MIDRYDWGQDEFGEVILISSENGDWVYYKDHQPVEEERDILSKAFNDLNDGCLELEKELFDAKKRITLLEDSIRTAEIELRELRDYKKRTEFNG